MTRRPDNPDSGACIRFETIETPNSQRVRSTTAFTDLRMDPGVDTRFPAELFTEAGDRILTIICNISRSGLQLKENRQLPDTLFPKQDWQGRHTPVPLYISPVRPRALRFLLTNSNIMLIYRVTMEVYFVPGMRPAPAMPGRLPCAASGSFDPERRRAAPVLHVHPIHGCNMQGNLAGSQNHRIF
jgi:hypothetical protein